MSVEKLAEVVGENVDRRHFLRRLGGATLGVAFAMLGLAPSAKALFTYKCCLLCEAPGCQRQGSCSWCWTCCHNGTKYRCCERYSFGGICDGSCNNHQFCSTATAVGSC